jgi:hypothetical protein
MLQVIEGLGTHAPSYETVHWWVNAIRNEQEERDDTPRSGAPVSAMDECHME